VTTAELIKRVASLEVKAKGISNAAFKGAYHSAFKGTGMTFSEVRDYQYGDDTRNIDWNVTARYNQPFVKVFEEERELSIILLVDTSASTLFGTVQNKKDLLLDLSATIGLAANSNNDKLGAAFFGENVETFIPAKKGKAHLFQILTHFIHNESSAKETNLANAMKYLERVLKQRSTVVLLSDFNSSSSFKKGIQNLGGRHDLICLQIYDPFEAELPNVGLIQLQHAENGQNCWIDTSNEAIRENYKQDKIKDQNEAISICKKAGVDFLSISTDEDFIQKLRKLFKQRANKK
jgi:uncharacterized protein (DUF58 family)